MNWRTILVIAHDVAAAGAAWIGAYLLRFNFEVPPEYFGAMLNSLLVALAVQLVLFCGFGLYKGIWRFASLPDLRRIALVVGTSAAATPAALAMTLMIPGVPRSVVILDPILLFMMLAGSRVLYRAWKEGHLVSLRSLDARPVLVVGNGHSAEALLRSISTSRQWRVVGVLDEDRKRHGRLIQGIPVLGSIEDIKPIAGKFGVDQVVIAMPFAQASDRRRAIHLATEAGMTPLTVPSVDELVGGRVQVSSIRRVDLEDLLGREQVHLDDEEIRGYLEGKVALVTGAGGSIGSELCRQIARYAPAKLVFFELNEFALYSIEEEFRAACPDLEIVCAIGDVKDAIRVDNVIANYRPDVIFHAAAYKHVPLMEAMNAWEAVRNNVLGTLTVGESAVRHRVGKFVLVSTDKAVNPVNVMGATKRLAEMVCQALQRTGGRTKFVMVRFGNVLGSAGSVIPKFRKQIAEGGPVTVTHENVQRYFMSIPEASQLVLQAGSMGRGGEIFVLDMGKPIKIADLARDMIRLSGCTEEEIGIKFTGLRPGEKLFEEVLSNEETTLATPHPELRIARARMAGDGDWLKQAREWVLRTVAPSDANVRSELQRWVPEYAAMSPVTTGIPQVGDGRRRTDRRAPHPVAEIDAFEEANLERG